MFSVWHISCGPNLTNQCLMRCGGREVEEGEATLALSGRGSRRLLRFIFLPPKSRDLTQIPGLPADPNLTAGTFILPSFTRLPLSLYATIANIYRATISQLFAHCCTLR